MNKYGKLAIGILVLGALMAGSVFAYQKLSEQYKIEPELVNQSEGQNQSGNQGQSMEQNEAQNQGTEQEQSGTGNQNNSKDTTTAAEEEGTRIIDFTVKNGEAEDVQLTSFVGKPIVLNFWASWCSPCKSEMPEFQKLYEEMGGDVEFVMVNLTDGSRETTKTAKAFLQKEGYSLPVYYDTKQEAAYAYYVTSIPTTYFIDKDGYIMTYAQGALDEETLRKGIGMITE